MKSKAHLVFAFYHYLTWYASPGLVRRFSPTATNEQAFMMGFLVSLVLYMKVGKTFIGEEY